MIHIALSVVMVIVRLNELVNIFRKHIPMNSIRFIGTPCNELPQSKGRGICFIMNYDNFIIHGVIISLVSPLSSLRDTLSQRETFPPFHSGRREGLYVQKSFSFSRWGKDVRPAAPSASTARGQDGGFHNARNTSYRSQQFNSDASIGEFFQLNKSTFSCFKNGLIHKTGTILENITIAIV